MLQGGLLRKRSAPLAALPRTCHLESAGQAADSRPRREFNKFKRSERMTAWPGFPYKSRVPTRMGPA